MIDPVSAVEQGSNFCAAGKVYREEDQRNAGGQPPLHHLALVGCLFQWTGLGTTGAGHLAAIASELFVGFIDLVIGAGGERLISVYGNDSATWWNLRQHFGFASVDVGFVDGVVFCFDVEDRRGLVSHL